MKTLKYMIAAALISATFFTGCKKGDNPLGTAANEISKEGTIVSSNLNYRLGAASQTSNTLIQWNKGYVTASELFFNGLLIDGSVIKPGREMAKSGVTVDLFVPSSLGTVQVPFNVYSGASANVNLNPLNGNSSLWLAGTAAIINTVPDMPPVKMRPVQLIIDQPVTLTSEVINNVKISQLNYTVTLTMDLNQLTSGIDAGMLENAMINNGIILISAKDNPNLYGIIFKNLQNNLLKMQLSTQLINTSNPVAG